MRKDKKKKLPKLTFAPRGPEKYKPEMCKIALELMTDGVSKKAVAAKLGVHRATLNRWEKKYPELCDTIKKGEELSEVWWEERARVNLENKNFHAVLWMMNMRNRFGWREQSPEQSITQNIQYGIILMPQPKPLETIIAEANQRALSAPVGGDANCPAAR